MEHLLIKWLFSRRSWLLKGLAWAAIGLWVYGLIATPSLVGFARVSFALAGLFAGIVILFASIPWYAWKYRGLGIEEHYENMLVPVTYLFLLLDVLYLWIAPMPILALFLAILFLGLSGINVLLLFYHLTDKDPLPPAFFAANLYLQANQACPGKPEVHS